MTRSECLKRSVECCRLAESAIEPEMKVYLLRLALSWMQAATSADERLRVGTEANVANSFHVPAFRESLHRGFDRSLVAAR